MRSRGYRAYAAVLVMGVGACVQGSTSYTPPTEAQSAVENSVVINRPMDQVWRQLVARLSGEFFVINNIDRSSGLINVSYSGDPEIVLDCGTVTSSVTNARGARTYNFPGARARAQYETLTNGILLGVERRIALEGRANILVMSEARGGTRVTANVRYVVTAEWRYTALDGRRDDRRETVSFNTGTSATIPGTAGTTCRSNGEMERRIIRLAQSV
jgi:hypothetical protein